MRFIYILMYKMDKLLMYKMDKQYLDQLALNYFGLNTFDLTEDAARQLIKNVIMNPFKKTFLLKTITICA